ncbi:hypothetical protein [Novosphingobium sp.]|uniref:hypothetical protein n=1 Tax=Novosphingobium sp. TaxID=1874826 RepID=UPI003B51F0B7
MARAAGLAVFMLAQTVVGTPALSQSAATASVPLGQGLGCELHVWPTRDGVANVQGVASVLLPFGSFVDRQAHKQTNQTIAAAVVAKIPPEAQAAAMKREDVLSSLRLPATTRVVIEDTLPAYDELGKDPVAKQRVSQLGEAVNAGRRISSSQSACYAELLVSAVGFARSPLDPPVLAVRWIFRRWQGTKPKNTIGWRRHWLPAGLGTNNFVAAQDTMMQDLYATTLIEWARAKVKS